MNVQCRDRLLTLSASFFLYPPPLSGALQATRALMIVAILFTVAGLGVASMGMKCTNCAGDDKVKKSRIAMTGGIILIVAGTFTLINYINVTFVIKLQQCQKRCFVY